MHDLARASIDPVVRVTVTPSDDVRTYWQFRLGNERPFYPMDLCLYWMFELCDLSKVSGPALRQRPPREVLRPSSWTHRAVRTGISPPTELLGAGRTEI